MYHCIYKCLNAHEHVYIFIDICIHTLTYS